MGRIARLARQFGLQITLSMLAQRGHLLCWVPIFMAVGIGIYFSLTFEPGVQHYVPLGLGALVLLVLARLSGEVLAPLPMALMLVALGFGLAGLRAHSLSEPVLGWRYYGAVEGRVIALDRSQSGALRLTLDQVRLDRVPPDRTPAKVRLSLHGDHPGITPEPGLRVMTTGHLSPPSGPVEPGGFDFQRHAWFVRLGAVGYARVPLLGAASAGEGQAGLVVFRVRMAASESIRAVLSGDTGGFAAAVTTGDRSAISRDALEALRASNLAHLLAISGLHMGLLTGVVFAAVRLLLALHPRTALGWPNKAIAAVCALIAATGYLALSGGNVATQRAFIMVAVALAALMIGRRAISLRAVAVAAIIVLVLRPEALLSPGFQMSFAATTALVAVFSWMRDIEAAQVPRWARPVLGVFMSSLVAGLATAPIAAAHFNAIAHYGLIANLLSVPVMGVLVIPAAVLALVLSPLGLESLGLWAMGLGLDWILAVAHTVAAIDGARGAVVSPGAAVVPLIAGGFLFLVLWQGRARVGGVAVMALAFWLWQGAERPAVLIADNGSLVGQMTDAGRAVSKPKGAGFVARNWLENDGTRATQEQAAARWPAQSAVIHLSGKRALARFEDCKQGEFVVASVPAPALSDAGCEVFDPDRLRHTGSIAAAWTKEGWRFVTARAVTGDRLWSHWPEAHEARDQYVRINPTSRP